MYKKTSLFLLSTCVLFSNEEVVKSNISKEQQIVLKTTNIDVEKIDNNENKFIKILESVVKNSINERNKREIDLEQKIEALEIKMKEEEQKQKEELFNLEKENLQKLTDLKRELEEERQKVLNMKQGKYEKELYILTKEAELNRIKHNREVEAIEEKKNLMEKKLEVEEIERKAMLPELKTAALNEIQNTIKKISSFNISFEDTNELIIIGKRFKVYINEDKINDIFEKNIINIISLDRIEEIKKLYKEGNGNDMYSGGMDGNQKKDIITSLLNPFKKKKSSNESFSSDNNSSQTGVELTNNSIIHGFKVKIDFENEAIVLFRGK